MCWKSLEIVIYFCISPYYFLSLSLYLQTLRERYEQVKSQTTQQMLSEMEGLLEL